MKTIHKLSAAALAALAIGSAGAGGLSGVLDGMFSNVTAPDVVSNQFRGTISGGGMYVRSPISSIQVMSIDPPRLSVGCGGIDLYLGSFSFITADKLTQFIRNVAQNAAPLAFKMALDASFPQLGGVLDKFQNMAQMMNDSQRNSCQLAHGLMDGAKNPEEVMGRLNKTVSDGLKTVKGWATDFTDAITSDQANPSIGMKQAVAAKNPDGTQVISRTGNVTWNALNVRKNSGFIFAITDEKGMAQQVLMSLIGTEVNQGGTSDTDEPVHKPFISRLRLKSLFRPQPGVTGVNEIPIWSCQGDIADCLYPTEGTFQTTGIEGYVRKRMLGSETATAALPGSIVYNISNCSSNNCGLTGDQLGYLNVLGKIPAVGMMMHAQQAPTVISMIAPELIDAMVDEISVLYGQSVLDTAITSYSNTDLPKPDNFDNTVRLMIEDIRDAEKATKGNLGRLHTMAAYIDSAIRANGAVLRYRPR